MRVCVFVCVFVCGRLSVCVCVCVRACVFHKELTKDSSLESKRLGRLFLNGTLYAGIQN